MVGMLKKKKIALALAIVFVLAATLGACGGGGTADTPTDTGGSDVTATTPADTDGDVVLADYSLDGTSVLDGDPESQGAPQAPTPVIVPVPEGYEDEQWDLKANEQGFPDMPMLKFERDAFEHIKVRTNGQVDITLYDSSTLLPFESQFSGVVQGIADMSIYLVNNNDGTQPIGSVFNTAHSTESWDTQTMTKIYRKFVFENDIFKEENNAKGVEWISIHAFAPSHIHTSGKAITTPDDMAGQKIICSNTQVPYLSAMGASGIVQGIADYYTSLEKSVANGIITHWPIMYEFSLTDVVKYHTMFSENNDYAGVENQMQGWIINKEVWDSIPIEYQEVILEEMAWSADAQAYNNDNMVQTGIANAETRGNELIRLTSDEAQLWYDAAAVSRDNWIETAVSAGGITEDEALELYNNLKEAIKNKDM